MRSSLSVERVAGTMHGTGAPLLTPFDDEGDVDYDALGELATWLTDAGVDFLVPCGSTSEAPLLTADERERVVGTVADAVDCPIVAGTGTESRRASVDAAERAAAAGADAVLAVTRCQKPRRGANDTSTRGESPAYGRRGDRKSVV